MIVTCDPIRAKNCASSEPTGPLPITARLSGTSCVEVASRFVQYSTSSRPVDRRDRRPRAGGDDEPVVLELLPVHFDDAGPRDPSLHRGRTRTAVPRATRAAPCRPSRSSPGRATTRRPPARGRSRLHSGRAIERRRELRAAQHRLRRHARVVRALAADEPALDERDLDARRRAAAARRRNARPSSRRRARRPSQEHLQPDVRPGGNSGSFSSASRTPSANDSRAVVSCRIVSSWPSPPKITSWCATSPGSRTEWMTGSPPIKPAVARAVPDGASFFASLCSSMISARGKYCAACSAKRIISTAPSEKFGATNTRSPRSRA